VLLFAGENPAKHVRTWRAVNNATKTPVKTFVNATGSSRGFGWTE